MFANNQHNTYALRVLKTIDRSQRAISLESGWMFFALVAICFNVFLVSQAFALPWDTDMYKQDSYKANEIARAPAKGTVPVGHKPFRMTLDEAGNQLQNPVSFSLDSVWRGRRLWNSNCLPCHGKSGAGEGPVGKMVNVPNLLEGTYSGRPDGRVYAVIQLGLAGMPRYGFKFSDVEKWSLVNYLRFLQGRDVQGMARNTQAQGSQ